MPQPSREQPQAEIAAGAEGEEPGGDRVAAGGAVAATLALGAGAYFRRRNSRLGFQGAITATAHKLARYVYAMLKREAYVSQSLEQYEAATQERIERTLRKKARALGYDPVPRQPLSPAVS